MSGGIDSGVIASVSTKIFNKKIKTFSIINEADHRYNEKDNIKLVSWLDDDLGSKFGKLKKRKDKDL